MKNRDETNHYWANSEMLKRPFAGMAVFGAGWNLQPGNYKTYQTQDQYSHSFFISRSGVLKKLHVSKGPKGRLVLIDGRFNFQGSLPVCFSKAALVACAAMLPVAGIFNLVNGIVNRLLLLRLHGIGNKGLLAPDFKQDKPDGTPAPIYFVNYVDAGTISQCNRKGLHDCLFKKLLMKASERCGVLIGRFNQRLCEVGKLYRDLKVYEF